MARCCVAAVVAVAVNVVVVVTAAAGPYPAPENQQGTHYIVRERERESAAGVWRVWDGESWGYVVPNIFCS